jgi:hypothetical protein
MALLDRVRGERKRPLEDALDWSRDPRWLEFNLRPGELDAEYARLVKQLDAAELRLSAAREAYRTGRVSDDRLDAVLDGAAALGDGEDARDVAAREIRALHDAIKTNRAALRRWERRSLELRWELRKERMPALETAFRDTLKQMPGVVRQLSELQGRLRTLRELAGNPAWPDLKLPDADDIAYWLEETERYLGD